MGAGESVEVAPHSLTAPIFAILVFVTAGVALALRDSVVWEGFYPFVLASSATSASGCSTRVTGLSNRMIQMMKTAAVATPHHHAEHLEAEVEGI